MENRFTMLNTPDNVCFTASNRQNRKGPTRVTENYEIELYLTDGATTFLCGKEIPIRRHLFFFARPGMERYTDEQLETFLAEEGLGKLLLAYAAEHPAHVKPYSKEYRFLNV